ncbi:MAG: flagellar biosynthesis protein FlgM [Betaproteobacteria bacterium]|nr:flagellar biosynthesis protein FlgM [Betaproteobacteria bacterium]
MRTEGGRQSDNIEDRRGMGISRGKVGGGIGAILLALVAMYFGMDPGVVMQGMQQVPQQLPTEQNAPPAHDPMRDFVAVVLADTEDVWNKLFQQSGKTYREPKLVLFTGAVQSAYGHADAAVGPFYCPGDYKLYIDLSFYQDLKQRFEAPGDFAQAYVIAHEVGHHVQALLGISEQVQAKMQQVSPERANALSVRMELQADCLAGVWAHHAHRTRQILEQGDVDEALNAAAQIGDDRMQMRSRGYVSPESFTHGSAEQRKRWFMTGLESGEVGRCDTFKARQI